MKRKLQLLSKYILKRNPTITLPLDIGIMHFFYKKKIAFMYKYWRRKIYYKYHVEIDCKATISSNVKFTHPIGIVIGANAVVHNNVTILQGVTIGGSFNNGSKQIIEENVILCAGSKVLGKVTVGKNSVVGANAVITIDVPENSVAVGYNIIIKKTANEYKI